MPMPTPSSEINLLETFANTKVIGLTINHEGMSDSEISEAILKYEKELGIPSTDALARPDAQLVNIVCKAFPEIEEKLIALTR